MVQFAIAVPAFIKAALYYVDLLEFWYILVLEMLFSVIRTLNPSTSQSLLRDLVPEDKPLNAVAIFSNGFNFARIVDPYINRILILWIDTGGCFLIHAVSLLISWWEILLMRLPKKELGASGKNSLQEVKDLFLHI